MTTIPHVECSNFGCAVLANKVYVIGGVLADTVDTFGGPETVHPFGFKFDPVTDSWENIPPMMKERAR